MLFGRKTPSTATPKPDAAPAAVPETGAAAPGASVSPLEQPAPASSVSGGTQPGPFPASAAPASAPQTSQASPQPSPAPTYRPPLSDKGPEMNASTPKPPAPSTSTSSFKPTDIPRRTVDIPGMNPRKPEGYAAPSAPAPAPAPVAAPAPAAVEQRRLIVGRDISLSGEIGSCDVLVVEGTVEAKLRDGRSIEIAEYGLFKGSVEIDEADIAGRFEGDINVRGRLTVRSTGKITGSIRYGQLAVDAGGQLTGDIQTMTAAAKPAAPASTPAPAPVADPVAAD